MKTSTIYKLMILLFAVTFAVSCVKDDDYDIPNLEVTPPVLSGEEITINALKQLLLQAQPDPNEITDVYTIDDDVYITGYVISNDEFGNIYEELILQDDFENPTIGVKVLVNVNPLFIFYEFGRKTHIQLQGLTVGIDGGVLSLGIRNGNTIDKLGATQMTQYIKRDLEVEEIVPLPMNISEFSKDKTNLYIRLSDMQFHRNDVLGVYPKTYAAEPEDEFDGERTLESCTEGLTAIFSTSSFADFKAITLPTGKGTLDGILTLNYFGETFNVIVNSPMSINFDSTERCDPDFFFCTTPSGGGDAFFSENFESFDAIEDLEDAGWTNVNTTGGNTLWDIGSYSGNNYPQITGHNTGESSINTWLVTPSINMDNTTKEELEFEIQASYDNGTILTVLYSDDFTGDVTTANWKILDATIPVGPIDAFGDFELVGPINISCIEGNVNFAFLYEGSDPGATTRYHMDSFKITGL